MDLLVPTEILCPYCGDGYETMIDTSVEETSLIEDCAVCCRPIALSVRCEPGEVVSVEIERG